LRKRDFKSLNSKFIKKKKHILFMEIVEFEATLYDLPGSTTMVLSEGYGITSSNNNGLIAEEGIIKAEKFGIDRANPQNISYINYKHNRDNNEEFFDEIINNITLRVYCQYDGEFVPTTTGNDMYHISSEFVLLDKQKDVIYSPMIDSHNPEQVILSAVGINSVQLLPYEQVDAEVGERFEPLIRINTN